MRFLPYKGRKLTFIKGSRFSGGPDTTYVYCIGSVEPTYCKIKYKVPSSYYTAKPDEEEEEAIQTLSLETLYFCLFSMCVKSGYRTKNEAAEENWFLPKAGCF